MRNIQIIGSTIYLNSSPVATMIDPSIFKSCCHSDLEEFKSFLKETNANYGDGHPAYDAGYDTGQKEGYDQGYEDGYDSGKDEGYDQGYEAAKEE